MVNRVNTQGLTDWLVQRVTAVIIGLYALFILIYLLVNPSMRYAHWHNLYHNGFFKIVTVLVLLSILWHAWIGLWTVFTDYVKNTAVRVFLQVIVIILLVAYLIWLLQILWL